MTPEKWTAVRKALYAVIPAVGMLAVAFGLASAETWQVIAGVAVQVIGLVTAFFNTSPSKTAEHEQRQQELEQTQAELAELAAAPAVQAPTFAEDATAPVVAAGFLGGQGEPIPAEPPLVNPQGAPEAPTADDGYEPKHAA